MVYGSSQVYFYRTKKGLCHTILLRYVGLVPDDLHLVIHLGCPREVLGCGLNAPFLLYRSSGFLMVAEGKWENEMAYWPFGFLCRVEQRPSHAVPSGQETA
jgi:hypothetical protein